MEELRIIPTKYTPEIILNPDGKLIIKGRSIHENDRMAPIGIAYG